MALFSPIEGRERDRVTPELYLDAFDTETSEDETRPDLCRTTCVHRLSLGDWDLLGRSERRFVKRLLIYTQLGKGALAELVLNIADQRAGDLSEAWVEKLEAFASEQYRHFRVLRTLNARIDVESEAAIRSQAADLLRYVFDRASPEESALEEVPRVPVGLALASTLVDVLFDTAFSGVEQILDRTDNLTGLGELIRELHSEDQRARERRLRALEAFRDRGDRSRELVDGTFDRSVMPCLKSIRAVQRQFDVLQMGLVPDEFVARALERLFELGSSPSVDVESVAS